MNQVKILCGMLAALMLCVGCRRLSPQEVATDGPFVTDVQLKTTPVTDQGRSELCWVHAMFSTIETERLMQGDSVRLSVDYPVRRYLEDRVRACYLSSGRQPISLRGMAGMALHLLDRYGVVPYGAYHRNEPVDYRMLCRRLTRVSQAAQPFGVLQERTGRLLDERLGALPYAAYLYGAQYTPNEFARSVCHPHGYAALTSFTHHPFGQPMVLEVPDNVLRDTLHNVPIGQLMACMEQALRHGHPVCWEGDITEPGFSFDRGVADLPQGSRRVDQARRQQAFECRRTTDDHCMALVGLAHDAQGRRWFIAKNSWGTANPYGGYMYLSYEYVWMKTIAIYLSYEADYL